LEEINKAKNKFGLPEDTIVMSCYEAGRDGFWIARFLESQGIINIVIDSSSIKVDRRSRRAKTDRLDAGKLLRQLIQHVKGEEKLQVARVPSEEEEDRRRMHRERERLKKERTSHTNRIKSLLNLFGIKCKSKGKQTWEKYFKEVKDWKGAPLPQYQIEELLREAERVELVEKQLKELESTMEARLKTSDEVVYSQIQQLKNLKAVGDVSSWILIMEWFGWRKFKNRREVGAAAGLVGTPYDSGESQREQGITKAGNYRIRALMLELAWSWLRYQPDSDLSKWFNERFGQGKRMRKVGIVALARKLLIAIWRYLEMGELPKGAALKQA
jgi:transposase